MSRSIRRSLIRKTDKDTEANTAQLEMTAQGNITLFLPFSTAILENMFIEDMFVMDKIETVQHQIKELAEAARSRASSQSLVRYERLSSCISSIVISLLVACSSLKISSLWTRSSLAKIK